MWGSMGSVPGWGTIRPPHATWCSQKIIIMTIGTEYFGAPNPPFKFCASKYKSSSLCSIQHVVSVNKCSQKEWLQYIKSSVYSTMRAVFHFAGAVTTKCHRLGGSHSRNLQSHSCGGQKSQIEVCWQGWFLPRPLSLASRWLPSLCVFSFPLGNRILASDFLKIGPVIVNFSFCLRIQDYCKQLRVRQSSYTQQGYSVACEIEFPQSPV